MPDDGGLVAPVRERIKGAVAACDRELRVCPRSDARIDLRHLLVVVAEAGGDRRNHLAVRDLPALLYQPGGEIHHLVKPCA